MSRPNVAWERKEVIMDNLDNDGWRRRHSLAVRTAIFCASALALIASAATLHAQEQTTPIQVSGLSDVTAIATGRFYSLALKSDGSVWAWGDNQYGQLGDGTTISRSSPVQVSLSGVTGIAAGDHHSLALRDNHDEQLPYSVFAWGRNTSGQLGNGDATVQFATTPIQSKLNQLMAIAGGISHTLTLRDNYHTPPSWEAYTWGSNDQYQLGYHYWPRDYCEYWWQAVQRLDVYACPIAIAIAAGGAHNLAVTSDGKIWAWGNNDYGQLGNAGNTDQNGAILVKAADGTSDLTDMVGIAAGAQHSLALRNDGTIWAWGYNGYGQLGDGYLYLSRNTPTAVCSPPGVMFSGAIAVAAGREHSLAIKSDGTVWAWGENTYGQLGDGSTTSRSSPVQVVGLTDVTAVAGGRMHCLALKNDGTVWAWGDNHFGQLGAAVLGSRANNAKYPILHLPGTAAERTLWLPRNALREHLDHGDVLIP